MRRAPNTGSRRRRRTTRRRPSRNRSRTYSVDYLLSRQPKTLAKHEYYPLLLTYYRTSPRLSSVRFSRRCYSLLNNARIAPHNLAHFYRTYRLPEDPFFPLFFKIKRDYLEERARVREARRQYILDTMRSLPPHVLGFIKYLGHLEKRYTAGGSYPLWQKNLFPATKKQARAYAGYELTDWVGVFRLHLRLLRDRYPALSPAFCEKLLACFVLEYLPTQIPPVWPGRPAVQLQYRRLSLEHHPDRGGDPRGFIELQWAREVLTGPQ